MLPNDDPSDFLFGGYFDRKPPPDPYGEVFGLFVVGLALAGAVIAGAFIIAAFGPDVWAFAAKALPCAR